MSLLKIASGTLYDPANGVDGVVRDLWIEDGRIVAAPQDPDVRPARTIDAEGCVVMPGGIDMHCHIAGPKVNIARKLRPEDKRRAEKVRSTAHTLSGTLGIVPSTFATGYKYAAMGYTTAFDAAIPPLAARHAHEELEDTPCIDKGFYVLMGNNHYVMQSIKDGDRPRLKNFIAWLLSASKGFAPKLVNPGGVEVWKQKQAGNVSDLDSVVDHFEVTPRQIITEVCRAANELGLPHPVHIHGNNLGLPGNWTTTLETMKALDGHRGHMTHIQFHSYGGGDADENSFNSKVGPLADYVNANKNVTVDVGQVMFGETTSMTGDGPLGYLLHNIYGTKWFSGDTELESGCGIAPIKYRNKSLVHATQWAVGLDWYLMVDNPWQVAMSTDHPNGGSFLAYPEIIHLLMSRDYRQECLRAAHPLVRERSNFADIDREYSLSDIAIITRAAPARMLGLANKGHLGIGADADVTVYTRDENITRMFECARYVIKSGHIVCEKGEIRKPITGKTLHVAPSYDQDIETDIADWFEKYYTIQFRNYPVNEDTLEELEAVATRV